MNSRRSSLCPHLSSLFLAAIILLIASAAFALEVPPPPTQWYTDKAGLLDSSQADALNSKLASFEQRTGVQFIIYVLPSLESDALEDFTIRAAEKWKVGNKKYDQGLILFVFVKEKKVRVEVGYGLEAVVPDSIASRAIREDIAPRFQNGDYAGGLNAAADSLIGRIEKGDTPKEPLQRGAEGARPGGVDAVSIIILLLVFFFFILPMLRRRGGGRSGCGGCFWPMFFFPGGGGTTFGGGGFGGGGGGGFGGFSGGGGSFGGGGASGGW
jgi:uncharacterized protein